MLQFWSNNIEWIGSVPLKLRKKILGRKNENDKLRHNRSLKRCSHKTIFSKMLKFDPFGGFSNFQKKFFFELQTYFCFPKKIFRLMSQIQPKYWTLFGGQNQKVRFRQHCRKMAL